MKICNKCNSEGDFGPDVRNSDGLQGICVSCRNSYQAEYNKVYNKLESTRDYKRNSELRQFWPDCSPKDARGKYNDLFSKQHGCCLICTKHQSEFKISLNVDHDHSTGQVRGLLCGSCNRMLGLCKDDNNILENAIVYLNRSKIKLAVVK